MAGHFSGTSDGHYPAPKAPPAAGAAAAHAQARHSAEHDRLPNGQTHLVRLSWASQTRKAYSLRLALFQCPVMQAPASEVCHGPKLRTQRAEHV